MQDPNIIRRDQDIKKIRELCESTTGRIAILSTSGNPIDEINLELKFNTVPSNRFPTEKRNITHVTIQLSNRYPLQEPTASIRTPIYHPNVYSSGKICLGQKWFPTEGLDLLVKRIIKIVTYDPSILNEESPANKDALEWYRSAKRSNPSMFPTDNISFNANQNTRTMSWNNITEEKVVVLCKYCNTGLRLPKGKSGIVRCPSCKNELKVST